MRCCLWRSYLVKDKSLLNNERGPGMPVEGGNIFCFEDVCDQAARDGKASH
jgi:hypothetical protein